MLGLANVAKRVSRLIRIRKVIAKCEILLFPFFTIFRIANLIKLAGATLFDELSFLYSIIFKF